MKNLKLFIAIVAISISSVVSANTEPTEPVEAKTELRTQIVSLLGNHNYELENSALTAEISVMLNNKSELVVVSVNSENEQIQSFVSSRLNYKQVAVKEIKKGTIYRLSVTLKQAE